MTVICTSYDYCKKNDNTRVLTVDVIVDGENPVVGSVAYPATKNLINRLIDYPCDYVVM